MRKFLPDESEKATFTPTPQPLPAAKQPPDPDFGPSERRHSPMAVDRDTVDEHGTNAFGVIYGSGAGNPRARGIVPDAEGVYTASSAIYGELQSRYQLTKKLIERYEIMVQTASWGHAVTEAYTEHSAELDRLIFDRDIPVTQSQGNEGSSKSRPEAWSKNVISVGAVRHNGNDDPSDDSWKSTMSRASVGPANDGRVKPDLIGYYDSRVATTSVLGYKLRKEFNGRVVELRKEVPQERGWLPGVAVGVAEQETIDRIAVSRALVEHGLLELRRRWITHRVKAGSCVKIS
jgi:hypothetical protein